VTVVIRFRKFRKILFRVWSLWSRGVHLEWRCEAEFFFKYNLVPCSRHVLTLSCCWIRQQHCSSYLGSSLLLWFLTWVCRMWINLPISIITTPTRIIITPLKITFDANLIARVPFSNLWSATLARVACVMCRFSWDKQPQPCLKSAWKAITFYSRHNVHLPLLAN